MTENMSNSNFSVRQDFNKYFESDIFGNHNDTDDEDSDRNSNYHTETRRDRILKLVKAGDWYGAMGVSSTQKDLLVFTRAHSELLAEFSSDAEVCKALNKAMLKIRADKKPQAAQQTSDYKTKAKNKAAQRKALDVKNPLQALSFILASFPVRFLAAAGTIFALVILGNINIILISGVTLFGFTAFKWLAVKNGVHKYFSYAYSFILYLSYFGAANYIFNFFVFPNDTTLSWILSLIAGIGLVYLIGDRLARAIMNRIDFSKRCIWKAISTFGVLFMFPFGLLVIVLYFTNIL